MINQFRYWLSYHMIDKGINLIPNEDLRDTYDWAIRTVSEAILFQSELEEFRNQAEVKTDAD